MNPASQADAQEAIRTLQKLVPKTTSTVVVCPPVIFAGLLNVSPKKKTKSLIHWGAQNGASEKAGAYTGELSAEMLALAGFEYVIIGHSERRAMGETDAIISRKVALALKENLTVILCVGETSRDEHGEYILALERQLSASMPTVTRRMLDRLIIAYEPVWAIGESSRGSATPEEVFESIILIRKILSGITAKEFAMKVPLLYGGSVDPENARRLIEKGGVQGLLVGRDSLDAERFAQIIREVDQAL